MTDVIYLAGAERSGTNYLEWLLKSNFKDTIVIVLWKHYPPRKFVKEMKWNAENKDDKYDQKQIDLFFDDLFVKNPAPYFILSDDIQKKKNNKKFIRNQINNAIVNRTIKFVVNIKNPYGWHLSYSKKWPKYKFPNDMHKWNSTYSKWLNFCKNFPDSAIIVKHEDLLKDHSKILEKIKTKFNLTMLNKKFKTVNEVMSTRCTTNKSSFTRKKHFMNEEYMKNIKEKNVIKCRKVLSDELMSEFNYKKI
jgi:hypothetical protein